jgi:hypothetical protein
MMQLVRLLRPAGQGAGIGILNEAVLNEVALGL